MYICLCVCTRVCVCLCLQCNLYCCSCSRSYELVKWAALMISTAAWCGLTRYLPREVLESGREDRGWKAQLRSHEKEGHRGSDTHTHSHKLSSQVYSQQKYLVSRVNTSSPIKPYGKVTLAGCLLNIKTCTSLCFDHMAELFTATLRQHFPPGVMWFGWRVMIHWWVWWISGLLLGCLSCTDRIIHVQCTCWPLKTHKHGCPCPSS